MEKLTKKEKELITAICEYNLFTGEKIAEFFKIKRTTVQSHLTHIYNKLLLPENNIASLVWYYYKQQFQQLKQENEELKKLNEQLVTYYPQESNELLKIQCLDEIGEICKNSCGMLSPEDCGDFGSCQVCKRKSDSETILIILKLIKQAKEGEE